MMFSHDAEARRTCHICQHREPAEGQACAICARRIRDHLDDILTTYALTTHPPTGVRTGGSRSAETSLPGGTDRMNWRAGIPNQLTTWARDWAEQLNLRPPDGNLAAIIGWFHRHLPSALARHPAIGEFAGDVSRLARTGRVLATLTEPGQAIACPGPAGEGCGHRLRIHIADDSSQRCPRCGTTWDPAWLIHLAAHVDADVWVDSEAAALASGIHASTLRRWAQAGKIRRERGLYELRSIRELRRHGGVCA